jgi:hypothetical protein
MVMAQYYAWLLWLAWFMRQREAPVTRKTQKYWPGTVFDEDREIETD